MIICVDSSCFKSNYVDKVKIKLYFKNAKGQVEYVEKEAINLAVKKLFEKHQRRLKYGN